MPLLAEENQNVEQTSKELSPQSRFSAPSSYQIDNRHRSLQDTIENANRRSSEQLVERCVLVAKQSDGYGLTVSGDYPVFVATVKPDGAAFRAGVRQGDRILKVNGMPVTSSNQQEVVRMISGGQQVALTLLGRSPAPISFAMPLPPPLIHSSNPKLHEDGDYHHRRDRSDSKATTITNFGYRDPNIEESQQREEWKRRKVWELVETLRQEKINLENLREKPNQGTRFEKSLQKIADIQLKLKNLDPNYDDERLGGAFPPNNNNKVEPLPSVKSWVDSGGMHYVQAVADVMPMEDESEDDDDLGVIEDSGPFSNLLDLKQRPGYLAIFIRYLLDHSNPSSLLFYLTTDVYQSFPNTKELRRFAYEIFSTFLIPTAPLQVPDISQPLIQQIDKVLRSAAQNSTSQEIDQLKKLFIPSKTKAVGEIEDLLADFRQKRSMGWTGTGVNAELLANLEKADHLTELRISERILYQILESLMHLCNGDLENCEPRTLALIMAIASVIKVVLNLKTNYTPWEKLLEKCPTFMTAQKSGSMLSKMKPKRTIQIKDHQFSLNSVSLTQHCYQCRDAVWGVNAQAYFCQYCDVIVHKQCAIHLTDHCYAVASQQQKSKDKSTSAATKTVASKSLKDKITGNVSASTTSLHQAGVPSHPIASSHRQPAHHRSNNRISDSVSVGGTEHHLCHAQQHRPSHSTSASLTPPMLRSHAVIGQGPPGHMRTGTHIGSRSSRLNEDEASDALIDMQSPTGVLSPITTIAPSTMCSSPASTSNSTSMLPPPVFSQKFDRIVPPAPPTSMPPAVPPAGKKSDVISPSDMPPMSPPPPPPTTQSSLAPHHAERVAENVKSMSSDSGIGTDVLTMLMGPDGRPHPVSRTHSMKSDPTTTATTSQQPQIRRNGRGANSLGAADSANVAGTTLAPSPLADSSLKSSPSSTYEKPNIATASTLTVGRSSDADGSSYASAVDLSAMAVTLTPSIGMSASPSHMGLEIPSGGTSLAQSPALVRAMELSAGGSTSSQASINEEEQRLMMERVEKTVIVDGDSDLEIETEVPSLESLVSWEVLRHLKPKEKKRQEVINELFHTERTHVRNLKILYQIFYRPMVLQRVIPPDLIKLLFGNIDDLLEAHVEMHQKMKVAKEMWRRNGSTDGLYGDVGELLDSMFDGPAGEKLMKVTEVFCQSQQHALDTLRARYTRAKDDPLSSFLAEAESNPICRKLQLKDMIPVEMQRLVKYPLLLETIAKYTAENSDDLPRLQNSVSCAKRILSSVNTAKRNAENLRRLDEIQKRLDFPPSEKGSSGESFFQKFDFRQHRLIYEGSLTWRQSKGKTIDLQVILLEHLLVFLTKSPDGTRLQLKIHEPGCIPVMRLAHVQVEEKSNDKRALTLFYTCDLRIFELVAQTATERKTWHRLIENQVSVTRADIPGDSALYPFTSSTPPQSGSPYKVKSTIVGQDEGPNGQLARIEQVHVMTHPSLVHANEIKIDQPRILEHAQPILTPVERLRRNDKMIITALVDKHNILSEILKEQNKGEPQELERIAEMMTGLSVAELKQRSSKELAMSAIVHGNRLLDSINKAMFVKKDDGDKLTLDESEKHLPSVACYKLTAVAAPLMNHLKALMQVIQDQDVEIGSLKQEVVRCRENSSGAPDRTASEETLLQPQDNGSLGSGSASGSRMVLRST
ncbi:regulator of G protein signaling-like domain-containing protein [Ditylenchus destructor]|nr:regulator of G protein signaling-like domain-containing protein [Ditylenchus destructor]